MLIHRAIGRAVALACLVSAAVPVVAQMPERVGQTFSFAGKRKEFKGDGWTSAVVISTQNSEGLISILEETWKPGYQFRPRFHKTHVESFFVVSGNVEWTVGGETRVLGPSDCVHIPPFTAFSAKVAGAREAKLVRMYQPGGYEVFQEYIETLTPTQLENPEVMRLLAIASDQYDATPDLLAPQPGKPTKYFDFRTARKTFEDDGASDVAVSSIDSGGRFNLREENWKENFVAGLHYHNTKTETFYVLGGRVEWTVGGETHVLTVGDAVHIPTNTPHTTRGLDGKKVHTLLMYQSFGYDTRLEFQNNLTSEQARDPVFQRMLRTINDFNPIRP